MTHRNETPSERDRWLQSWHHSRGTQYYVFTAASASFHSSLTSQSKRRLHGYCLPHVPSTPLHRHIRPCINSTQFRYLPKQPSIFHADKCLSTSLGKFTLSGVRGSGEHRNRGAKVVQSQKKECRVGLGNPRGQKRWASVCAKAGDTSGARLNAGGEWLGK